MIELCRRKDVKLRPTNLRRFSRPKQVRASLSDTLVAPPTRLIPRPQHAEVEVRAVDSCRKVLGFVPVNSISALVAGTLVCLCFQINSIFPL
jgi:hypothetical protein